jgi:hypothetical protein
VALYSLWAFRNSYRLDALSFLVFAACVLAAVWASTPSPSSAANGGLLGLSLLYVVQLSGLGQWALRQAELVDAQMVRAWPLSVH